MSPKIHIQTLNIVLPMTGILAQSILSDMAGKKEPAPGRFELACNGEAVIDHKTGLMWTRDDVMDAELPHAEAVKAARAVSIGGFEDWGAPEIDELLSIVDYDRNSPAINTDFFRCKHAYYWTKTPYSASSSGYAWIVSFNGGNSYDVHHSNKCRVRACRRVCAPSQ